MSQMKSYQTVIDQVYKDFSGHEFSWAEQRHHRVPLDCHRVTPEGQSRQQKMGIPSTALLESFRCDTTALAQVRHVALRFIGGYHAALDTPEQDILWQRIQQVEDEFRDFAIEGVGMGYAILDLLMPEKRIETWLNGPAAHHIDIFYIGVGLALAKANEPVEPYIADLDPIMRWKVVDGYGFTFGMLRWEEGIEQLYFPCTLSEDAQHVYHQGLGRSLWFAYCGNGNVIADIIARFHPHFHDDLWSGAAFGATKAGGVTRSELEQFRTLGQQHLPAIAQGVSFAVEMRGRSGSFLPWNELACQVFWQIPINDVYAIAQRTLRSVQEGAITGQENPYQQWRMSVQQTFTEQSRATALTN